MNSNKEKIPTNKNFGIVFFVVFLVISLWPLLSQSEIRYWSLFISIIFLILGLLDSKILTPFNKTWSKFGFFLGKIISPLILGILFFLVVTPIGFMMRVLGKDMLNLKYNKNTKSYWIEKDGPKSKMKNQF